MRRLGPEISPAYSWFAVVVFGSQRHISGHILPLGRDGRVFGNAKEAQEALRTIKTSGRKEDAYLAMIAQIENLDFSACMDTQFLLFTDEGRDEKLMSENPHLTFEFVRNELLQHRIVLHVIVKEMYAGPNGQPLLGIDSNKVGYKVAANGSYVRIGDASWLKDTANGNTNVFYTRLALSLNGTAWDISKLRQLRFRQGLTEALITRLRDNFKTVCELCSCVQGVYSCEEVGANRTLSECDALPLTNYFPDYDIFYTPFNPVLTHGEPLSITLLPRHHTTQYTISTTNLNTTLADNTVTIVYPYQIASIVISVTAVTETTTAHANITVSVIPCSVVYTPSCDQQGVDNVIRLTTDWMSILGL